MTAVLERRLRVQIVEDERIVALDLRSGLEQMGYEVVGIAANESAALELADRTAPDLVLMDIHLDRGSDGIAAARQLRERYAVPVVFLTAYSEPETLSRAAESAPYGYLLKPFELRELNATVRMAMARRAEERKTEAAERRLLLALESARMTVLELDASSSRLRWSGHAHNPALAELSRTLTLAELQRQLDAGGRSALDALILRGEPVDRTCAWAAPDAAPRWLEIHARHFESEALIMGMVRDVTDRVHAEARLRQAVAAFDATEEAMLFLDGLQRVLSCNPAFSTLTLWTEDEVRGRCPHDFLYARRHGDRAELPQQAHHGEVTCWRRDGSTFPALEHLSPVLDENGEATHFVLSFADISEIRDTQFKLQHLALHDPLTGLGNRLHLQETLQAHQQGALALIFLDLDGFKTINDTLGHETGDELLKAIATRLSALLRREDLAVRLGGDEFVVLMAEPRRAEDALQLAEKLLHAVAQPVQLAAQRICVSASAGVALYPQQLSSPGALLKAADAAMYEAKARGRNRASLFDNSMTQEASALLQIEQGLRQVLQTRQLRLHWQPMVRLADGAIIGAEALLRWHHPKLGEIGPQRFIPVAESCGLICAIGSWVLEQACGQLAEWRAAGLLLPRIAVNVSVRQFEQQDLLGQVRELLRRHALPPDCLELEVTESLFAQAAQLRGVLQQLRALGVRIALDDFGTGFSSLGQLTALPLDRLKIDRSFVAELGHSNDAAAVVLAVVTLARSLGLAVIAEGVETEAQREHLRELGVEEAQGWLYHRALSAAAITALLDARGGRLQLPPKAL
ncbi:EAL domain-containing protein [Paucibacter sp. APW11]|uniref:EAL domain-containing protein n=1 Tax=Roseateles aquae TaxID=3077235 RepID=A0ABU3PCH2_9BURK|nr:EAL domain-containing protein [Paucibacter sp. APW11]MDT9000012.1 EAL domain-containing protein [Paucibacter sp. APW11]